jgi:hypothetical protein
MGTYRWVATFDSTNPHLASQSSGCQAELVDIGEAPSSIETVPSAASQAAGTSVTDRATVTAPAGITPTGTVTFRLYGPNDDTCDAAPIFVSSAVGLPAAAPFTVTSAPPFTPTVAGTYRWVATFDSTNPHLAGVSSGCQDELVDIGLAPSSIETVPSTPADGQPAGTPITDEATVSAAPGITPTGTVTFRLYGPNDDTCDAAPVFISDAIDLPAAAPFRVTSAPPFTPTVTGTYRWVATFDSTNPDLAGVSSGCQDELIDIGLAPSSIETVPSTPADGQPAGTPITDEATVTAPAGITPTGTVTFRLYGPDNPACTGAPAFVSNAIALPGAAPFTVTSAPSFTPTVAGTYRWVATFDSTNPSLAGNSSGCQDELIDIGLAPSSIHTVPSATGQPVSTAITDQATVTAPPGITPTGTVTFRLYGPNNDACDAAAVFVSNAIPLPGLAPFTVTSAPSFTPTAVGTYRWVATFDSTNPSLAGSSSGCQDELVDISKANPTITTTVFDSAANAAWTNTETTGASAFDTANIGPKVDGIAPTGTVTYSLFSGNSCAASAAITSLNGRTWPERVTLTAAGLVPNSQATGPLAAGEYSFRAVYSGDGNYAGADSACEPFNVAAEPAQTPSSVEPAPAAPSAPSAPLAITGLLLSHYLLAAAALFGAGVALLVGSRRSRTRHGRHFHSSRQA